MKVAILGNGIEGQSLAQYFTKQAATIKIFDNFNPADLPNLDNYDLVFRSPSVPPHQLPKIKHLTTATQYFFDHCPAPIIGVTGTKGKGTTCSLIAHLLKSFGHTVHLVGNIGKSAITALPRIKENHVVIYEMSSFQLWDLSTSPHIAVILRIEPDHLNIHANYQDYLAAKGNIARHQTTADFCIYYKQNPDSVKLSKLTPGTRLPYPPDNPKLTKLLTDNLPLPGQHNIENAEAALTAIACFYQTTLPDFLRSRKNLTTLKSSLQTFQPLPHRIQFIRELNHVKYYDDNYSSALPALDVALTTFADYPTVLIAGGINKGTDEATIRTRIFSAPNLLKTILIGETKEILSAQQNPRQYICAETLATAVTTARDLAENYADDTAKDVIVLMSPGHASFDMFQNFSDRGDQFTKLVNSLK